MASEMEVDAVVPGDSSEQCPYSRLCYMLTCDPQLTVCSVLDSYGGDKWDWRMC